MSSLSAMVKYLVFTLTIAAAHADASPHQRLRLKLDLLPLIKSEEFLKHGKDEKIWAKLKDIMGDKWAPSGEWLDQINVLIEEKKSDNDDVADSGRSGS